jgi:hypothetical protein
MSMESAPAPPVRLPKDDTNKSRFWAGAISVLVVEGVVASVVNDHVFFPRQRDENTKIDGREMAIAGHTQWLQQQIGTLDQAGAIIKAHQLPPSQSLINAKSTDVRSIRHDQHATAVLEHQRPHIPISSPALSGALMGATVLMGTACMLGKKARNRRRERAVAVVHVAEAEV